MGGASTDGGHPLAGPILKKILSATEKKMLPWAPISSVCGGGSPRPWLLFDNPFYSYIIEKKAVKTWIKSVLIS